MQDENNERVRTCDLKNSQLQNTAESMRLSILGKDSKTKDDKPLDIKRIHKFCCVFLHICIHDSKRLIVLFEHLIVNCKLLND